MKIVLFDIDDTLVSCNHVNSKSSEVMFKKVFNINASEDQIDKWGKTEKGIIEEVLSLYGKFDKNIDIPNQAYLSWAKAAAEMLNADPPKVLPGIKELLAELSQNPEILIVLLTGNSRLRAEAKLKSVGLDKYFLNSGGILNGVFGDISSKRSDLIPNAKGKFGNGVYILIDDSLVAAKAAKENNIKSILVATGNAPLEKLKEYTPFIFENFGEGRWKKAIEIINKL